MQSHLIKRGSIVQRLEVQTEPRVPAFEFLGLTFITYTTILSKLTSLCLNLLFCKNSSYTIPKIVVRINGKIT